MTCEKLELEVESSRVDALSVCRTQALHGVQPAVRDTGPRSPVPVVMSNDTWCRVCQHSKDTRLHIAQVFAQAHGTRRDSRAVPHQPARQPAPQSTHTPQFTHHTVTHTQVAICVGRDNVPFRPPPLRGPCRSSVPLSRHLSIPTLPSSGTGASACSFVRLYRQ